MWSIESIGANYITVTDLSSVDHFFISGTETELVEATANAVTAALNAEKKQPELKMSMRLNDELMVLTNGVKIGTSGPIRKITGYQYFDSENQDRKSLLDKLIKYCS